jgi:HlyD family secretion protein
MRRLAAAALEERSDAGAGTGRRIARRLGTADPGERTDAGAGASRRTRRRLAAAGLGMAVLAALGVTLALAGRFGKTLAPGGRPGTAPAPELSRVAEVAGGVPVEAVVRRDFVHLVPAEGNLRAVRSTPLAVPLVSSGFFRIAWIAPDGARVRAGDVVVRFDATEIEKTLADAEGDLAAARLKAGKARSGAGAELDKLERDAAMARIELENASRFQKKDPLLYSRNDIIESQLDQELAVAKERHARELRHTREELGRADSALLAVDTRRAELKIRQARESLGALRMVAPHDGVLILKRNPFGVVPHVGDVAFSGMALAEIPELAAMEAEVYVLEADAGGLAVGRPASVEVEAAPGVERAARIVRVDAVAKPKLRGSPVQYFAVTLRLDRTDPRVMKPGQRVKALLRLAEERGALVAPWQVVFERGGRKVVYRRRAGGAGFEEVPVTLGPAGLGTTVLASGVAEGDLLAMRDPTGGAGEAGAGAAAGAGGAVEVGTGTRAIRVRAPAGGAGLP